MSRTHTPAKSRLQTLASNPALIALTVALALAVRLPPATTSPSAASRLSA